MFEVIVYMPIVYNGIAGCTPATALVIRKETIGVCVYVTSYVPAYMGIVYKQWNRLLPRMLVHTGSKYTDYSIYASQLAIVSDLPPLSKIAYAPVPIVARYIVDGITYPMTVLRMLKGMALPITFTVHYTKENVPIIIPKKYVKEPQASYEHSDMYTRLEAYFRKYAVTLDMESIFLQNGTKHITAKVYSKPVGGD